MDDGIEVDADEPRDLTQKFHLIGDAPYAPYAAYDQYATLMALFGLMATQQSAPPTTGSIPPDVMAEIVRQWEAMTPEQRAHAAEELRRRAGMH